MFPWVYRVKGDRTLEWNGRLPFLCTQVRYSNPSKCQLLSWGLEVDEETAQVGVK